MGMSASQARLLALTARQSNLEYEGQQINQQRTNLSNQSANYYNSLLTMSVPTPPSTDDYTTVKYTFSIGGNDATVSQVLPKNDGTYLVSYTTNLSIIGVQENKAYKVSANASTSKNGYTKTVAPTDEYNENAEYYVQTFRKDKENTTTTIIDNNVADSAARITAAGSNAIFFDANGFEVTSDKALKDGKLQAGFTAMVTKQAEEEGYSAVNIKIGDKTSFENAKKAGEVITAYLPTDTKESTTDYTENSSVENIYAASNSKTFSTVSAEYADAFGNSGLNMSDYYQYEASTGIRFALKQDVERSANNENIMVITFAVASMIKKETSMMDGAQVEFDTSGRVSTVTDKEGNTYAMTAATETDDEAYEDAYNKYIYEQYVYDQKQNEINANIEILQAQDKNLELRLSQLNTEHSAIQTEMEAVNKVLSKNIESSFKTFNA